MDEVGSRRVRGGDIQRRVKMENRMKNPLKLAALLAAGALTLTACSSGAKPAPASGDDGDAASGDGTLSGTVEYWSAWTEGADTEKGSLEMISKFQESTGCTVNHTNFTYDMLREKIIASAAGGNLPDVIWGLPEYVGEFYKLGILADLTSAWDGWDDRDQVSEAVKEAMTIDGQIIGFPYEATTRALLAHDDMLAEAGVEAPKTWNEILDNGTKVEEATGAYFYGLAAAGVRAPQELLVYLAQKGLVIAEQQSDGGFKNTWNENPDQLAKAAEVFEFYQQMLESGAVNPNSATYGWEETDENFATGMTVTYVTGNWLAEREESNPDTMADISIHSIPVPEGGVEATYLEAKPLMVMATSKSMDCAVELAKWNASEEWQKAAFPNRSALSSVTEDTKWVKDFQALQEHGVSYPPVALGGVTQAMIDAIAMAVQEGAPAEEVASFLSDEVNASLESSGDLAG